MTTHSLSPAGTAVPTPASKQLVARAMYGRGLGFLHASALLHKQSGYQWAVLFLVCQGTELVLKAFLLSADYAHYRPLLPNRAHYGHNLEKLATSVHSEFGRKRLNHALARELHQLNDLYLTHFLRYADLRDFLIDPATVKSERVFKWVLGLPAVRAKLR
jgi:hypothetical protein